MGVAHGAGREVFAEGEGVAEEVDEDGVDSGLVKEEGGRRGMESGCLCAVELLLSLVFDGEFLDTRDGEEFEAEFDVRKRD